MPPLKKKEILIERRNWQALHSHFELTGLKKLTYKNELLVTDIVSYTDDVYDKSATIEKQKNFVKSGINIITCEGSHLLGNKHFYRHTYRYAENNLKITNDIRFSKGAKIKRHFGVSCFKLHGQWESMFCYPPIQHWLEGDKPYSITINQKNQSGSMIAHWHRIPLALQFKRKDGLLFELITGSDIWRWDRSLGFRTETSNYKIIAFENYLELIREPLMTCEEFTPQAQDYRFSSFLSWCTPHKQTTTTNKKEMKLLKINEQGKLSSDTRNFINSQKIPSLIIDFNEKKFKNSHSSHLGIKLSSQEEKNFCFLANKTDSFFKSIAKKLLACDKKFHLVFRNFVPSFCTKGQHYHKKEKELNHWDINYLIDLGLWWKNKFPKQIFLEKPSPLQIINQLFHSKD